MHYLTVAATFMVGLCFAEDPENYKSSCSKKDLEQMEILKQKLKEKEKFINGTECLASGPISFFGEEDYRTIPRLGRYRLYQSPESWSEARKSCIHDGGYLSTVNSTFEEEELVKYIKNETKTIKAENSGWNHDKVWIGTYKHEDNWVMVCGAKEAYKNWEKDDKGKETHPLKDQNCACLNAQETKNSSFMNSFDCSEKLPYVCEIA